MAVDCKKSCCLTTGPRCDAQCVNLPSVTGSMLPWVNIMRYLGVYFTRAKYFKCLMPNAPSSVQPTLFLEKTLADILQEIPLETF